MARTHFVNELNQLNIELIDMGTLIEIAIDKAIHALNERDAELAQEAIEFDDKIDKQERKIEQHCIKLLMNQQPVAKDLRMISCVLKIITDMERIGDHASDISELTKRISNDNNSFEFPYFEKMAKICVKMVTDAVDAFVTSDLELCRNVIAMDDQVDALFNEAKESIIASLQSNNNQSDVYVDALMIVKYFERIGDHAVNIAEWVIFSITGMHKDIRIV